MIPYSAKIHIWAHVDRNSCRVGAGTVVHQFASVTRFTVLGEDCVVWPFAMLDGPVIGDRCKIASHTVVPSGVSIGNDVFVGSGVNFCNDMWPRVDRGGYDDAALRSGEKFAVIVEDGVSIGVGTVILPGIRIGAGAMIGAGCVVRGDVMAGVVVYPGVADDEFAGLRQMRREPDLDRQRRMRWAR